MVTDVETREVLFEFLKDRCSLKTVLRLEKPCPYFGPSNTCSDCSFDWMTVAGDVLKVVSARRASYEQEKKRRVDVQDKYDALNETHSRLCDLVDQLLSGVEAANQLRQLRTQEEESKDVRRSSDSEDQASVPGGGGIEADREDGIRVREVPE